MALITADQIKLLSYKCDYKMVASSLDIAAQKYDINTNRRIRHWLAQMYYESAGFTRLTENMNYSSGRLMEVWPSRFPDTRTANQFAGNPTALAEKVYGGRLGNTSPGDGAKYIGRGYTQLTGKANYVAAGKALQMDLVGCPDLLTTHSVAAKVAAWYWQSHNLNQIVDRDSGETLIQNIELSLNANETDDMTQARKVINGSLSGLSDVRKILSRTTQIWPD